MDLGPLRDLVLDINLSTHGVPVTITRPLDAPFAAIGVWLTPLSEDIPEGDDYQRRSPRRVMAFGLDDVTSIPIGTVVSAPPALVENAVVTDWKVDGYEPIDPVGNTIRVKLIPVNL